MQAQFALDQARKAYAAAPALSAQLPSEARLSGAGLRGFRLAGATQCVYVDHAGRQHSVAPQVGRSRAAAERWLCLWGAAQLAGYRSMVSPAALPTS